MDTILIIDDHEMVRNVLRDLLGLVQPGVSVLEANDGREGLAVAQAEKPDLILLDIHMPVMDGYETALALNDDPELNEIPIIIVTTDDEAGPTIGRLRPLCHGFLKKPFSMDELAWSIERVQQKK